MIQARLVVVGGEVKTSEIKLRLPCTIGRGRGSSIVLAHPLVSRQHCEIFEAEGKLQVRDLGSLNGTFVNNQRIGDVAALPPNELLTVGTVTFRAVYDANQASADDMPLQPAIEDTVYAGRSPAPSGTGTVPLPEIGEKEKTKPPSASDSSAFPPAAQLPAATGEEGAAPSAESEDAPKTEPAPDQAPLGESDDDFQDFLKSLEKDE